MKDFSGRTAFITGGAQGIGLGIARRLAREGVKIAIADIDTAALEQARQELEKSTRVAAYNLDVRDREAYARVADDVEDRLGAVSLLFNNAGIASGASAARMTYKLWDWVLGVNVHGVVNGIQTFVPRMIQRGSGGHVVNTSSGAGLAATDAGYLYTTSKYAVVGLSESLRRDLQPSGIGVSVLCPGPVATNIVSHSLLTHPGAGGELQPAVQARLKAMQNHLHEQGVGIDAVGQMVLEGILADRPFIFTDRMIEELITQRTKDILACLPAPPAADPG